jgi:uncharacterized protein DUF3168
MTEDIRPALRAYLLGDGTIAAAVGNGRVHPTVLPQGTNGPTVPAIVYTMISEITDHHTQGPSGLVMVRMQVDAYAATAGAADDLARAIKSRIDGFAGAWGYGSASPQAIVTVQGVFAENARNGYEADTKLFRSGRDYLIHFEER